MSWKRLKVIEMGQYDRTQAEAVHQKPSIRTTERWGSKEIKGRWDWLSPQKKWALGHGVVVNSWPTSHHKLEQQTKRWVIQVRVSVFIKHP